MCVESELTCCCCCCCCCSLLIKFANDSFDEDTVSTVGANFREVAVSLEDGRRVRLDVWDTAGQERFR